MKRTLLFILAFLPMLASADPVEIGGICYNLVEGTKEAEVTANLNIYRGDITIPESVEYEGITYSVTAIGDGAFYYCTGLKSVTIPQSVTTIGESAFDGCKNLSSVTIANGVTSIGNVAFQVCTSLTSLTIPNSVTAIAENAFQGCSGLQSIVVEKGNIVYDSREDCNALIKTSDNKLITGCMNTTIPNSITAIGSWAFFLCDGLTSINIPNSVTSIGQSAFWGCKNLVSINIPNSVTEIEEQTFALCEALTSITIPNSVTTIGSQAFSGCVGLTSVTIPNSVTSIEAYAFSDCQGLISITIPNSVTSIGESAFDDCSGLTSITIPSSVTHIGDFAFSGCSGLTSITIPDNLTSISRGCFYGCSGLTSFTISNNVTIINSKAFSGCSGLTSIIIPNSVTEIGESAFQYCSGAASITIGSNVKTIGPRAFSECKNLLDVYCYAENVPETHNSVFNLMINNNDNVTLHVPAASISAYQAVEPWRNFKEIVALPEQMAYRPFVEDGKVWKVGVVYSGNPVQLVQYYYFDGDTIVNGKTCKQMMCQRYVNPDYAESNNISPYNSLSYVGAWYEEDKKVYEYDTTDKQFRLMYDFSLEDNGTFHKNDLPYVYVIGPRKTGGIKGFKGVYREVRERDEERIYKCAPWMEGVGIVYGPPISNILNVELEDPAWLLMSCIVGEEVIYLNDGVEDGATPWEMDAKKRFDFTHTIKTKPKTRSGEEEQPLYGEYNDQQLGINLDPLDEAYLVRITNESDKVVYEKTVNAGSIVGLNIDISAFAKGRYTVTMENSSEVFTGEFETITTGIQELINEEETKNFNSSTLQFFNSIYNLQGQRLNTLQKGLNIVNGRKVFVK